MFLPIGGDGPLTIILSGAFLLAEDRSIKNPTILHQNHHMEGSAT